MNELSSKSRALLDAARSARPAAPSRDRIGVGLATRIGAAAFLVPLHGSVAPPPSLVPPMAPPPVPAPLVGAATTLSVAKGVVAIGVVLSSIGGGVLAARLSGPSHSPPAMHSVAPPSSAKAHAVREESAAPTPPTPLAALPAESAAPPASVASSVVASVATGSLPEPPRAAPAIARRAARPEIARGAAAGAESSIGDGATETPSPPVKISLGDETALLRDALGSLKQGDGAEAIAKLDELEARHPGGALKEERLAARVFALCAAGRIDEAREAGRRFLEETPTSVQADRVRASCAFSRR